MLNGPWMKLQPEKHMVTRACTPQGQGPGSFHQVRWTAKLAEDEETLKQILAEWRSICCSPETRGSSRGCDESPQLFKCCWQITQSCSPHWHGALKTQASCPYSMLFWPSGLSTGVEIPAPESSSIGQMSRCFLQCLIFIWISSIFVQLYLLPQFPTFVWRVWVNNWEVLYHWAGNLALGNKSSYYGWARQRYILSESALSIPLRLWSIHVRTLLFFNELRILNANPLNSQSLHFITELLNSQG